MGQPYVHGKVNSCVVLKTPIGVIYKDGINTSANIDGFPKEHYEITEKIQFEQKENGKEYPHVIRSKPLNPLLSNSS